MAHDIRTRSFPENFLWGAATSSHQVEGGNYWNDWWLAEQSGQLPYQSGAACRHYQLYEQDFDLARAWGHNAHRFSLEWSRIEPAEGQWNADAVSHYRQVLSALRQRRLEPVVTLHHFTNPAWFAQLGGWLHRDSAQRFARYAEYVATELGADVKYWLTINEPTVYIMQGYVNGEWPPFQRQAWRQAAVVCRRLAQAHKAAYQVLHRYCPNANVGFAHSAPYVMPCNPARWQDRLAASLRDWLLNGVFFRLIGQRPHRHRSHASCLDFLGLNYYTRAVVKSQGFGLGAFLGRACHELHHVEQGPVSDIGWEIYPAGLRLCLEKFSAYGVPLLVTENGIATDDEVLRNTFFHKHMDSLVGALTQGIPVVGYLYWSLMDNFEWAEGARAHFGLAAVDPQTQQRIPRPIVAHFKRICCPDRR